MNDVESRVYLKYETLYGALPIRLVEDPTDRMLHEKDVIKFVGGWRELKGYYEILRSVQFMRRKSTYTLNGTMYPLILGPGQYIQLDMSDLLTYEATHLIQYRVGIPDGITVILSYPSGNTLFTMDKPVYRMTLNASDDRRDIGEYTSKDSPWDAPRLEITNCYNKEENVYITVRNDSPDYRKAVLNLYINKLTMKSTGETKEYIPFYHSEVIL